MYIPSNKPRISLKGQLFGYMLALVSLLLAVLLTGLFLLGSFTDAKAKLSKALDMQLLVYEKEISNQTDGLAAMGMDLSRRLSNRIYACLKEDNLSFSALAGSQKNIEEMEQSLFEPLSKSVWQADCSGAFVILNTTVNDTAVDSGHSRSGLYLQKSGIASQTSDLLLYRGSAEIGKSNGAMPHRKWRLEFDTDNLPDFQTVCQSSYMYSNPIILPGTSEQVMLLCVPLIGNDNTVYGICGFEISESYFKQIHAQPTQLSHLTCILTSADGDVYHTANAMNCGVLGGYYYEPKEDLAVSKNDNGLLTLSGETDSYVGVAKTITLSPDNPEYVLLSIIPKQDYDRIVVKSRVQVVLLITIVTFLAIFCCMFFNRRFLVPLLKALEQIRQHKFKKESRLPEINDLLEFLELQDKLHDDELSELIEQQHNAEQTLSDLQLEIEQLTGEKRENVDPDRYAIFRESLSMLTPKEREVFDLYMDGHNAKEIQTLLNISENTLKYHNRNLYSKLGISTRKELLQFSVILRHEQERENAK